MKYYEIMLNDTKSKSNWMVCYAGDFRNTVDFDRYAIFEGKYIENWDLPLKFFYIDSEGSVPVDYMATDIGWELVSPRIKEILVNLDAADLQFLPVEIYERDKKTKVEGYSVINVTNYTDALDLTTSVYTINTVDSTGEQYYSFIKSALLANKLADNRHYFRVGEDRFTTFVSESVRKAVKKNRVIGCDFLEVLCT